MKNLILIFTGRMLTTFIVVIKGFVFSALLGPELLGLFSKFTIAFTYSKFSHMGLINAVDKKLPSLFRDNDNVKAEAYYHIARTYTYIVALTVAIFAFSYVLYKYDELSLTTMIVFIVFPACLIMDVYYRFFLNYSRARLHYTAIFKYEIILALSFLILGSVFVYLEGVNGAFISILISYVVAIIYVRIKEKHSALSINFNLVEAKKLFKVGFPVFFVALIFSVIGLTDRFIVMIEFSNYELGIYQFSWMVISLFMLVSTVYASVTYPKALREKDELDDKIFAGKYIINPFIVFSVVIGLLSGIAYYIAPYMISELLPEFVEAQELIGLFAFGAIFYVWTQGFSSFLNVFDREKTIIKQQVIGFIINVGSAYILLSNGYGLPAIAISTIFSYVFFSVTTLYFILTKLGFNIGFIFKLYITGLYFPALTFLMIYFSDGLVVVSDVALVNILLSVFLVLFMQVILLVAIVFAFNNAHYRDVYAYFVNVKWLAQTDISR